MKKIKWFSGGSDRRSTAINILDELLSSENLNKTELANTIKHYINELKNNDISTQFILSRMSLDIANVLRKYQIELNEAEKQKITELNNLINIRYGY